MQNIRIENLLFVDIETVPQQPDFNQLSTEWQTLWTDKVRWLLPTDTTAETFYPQRAGIMAEFAKVICISMGFFAYDNGELKLRVKSFYAAEEKQLLSDILAALRELDGINNRWIFTGHNIKEFAIPFLCRRMLANGISIPPYLDFQNMKPWTVNMLDTFQYWRFGDYKNYTSLRLLAATLGVATPNSDMDSTMVAEVYYQENDMQRIVNYCQNGVITVANIVRRFKNLPLLQEGDIVIVKS